MSEHTEVAVPKPGKCARCGRALKHAYEVNGVPYGPVCVRKLGFAIASDGVASRKRKAYQEPPMNETQLSFFEADAPGLDVVYTGTILGNDEDRIVAAHRPGQSARPLPLHLQIVNHSPTGFCWGYGGSGPAQLAFAILYDYLRDKERALSLYQDFKFKIIGGLPMDKNFQLTGQQVEAAITEITIGRLQHE
ncbi:Uncharacterised protein [uncultured archaeon]|nr:Uncharacterised protein [uncultured archaeon]